MGTGDGIPVPTQGHHDSSLIPQTAEPCCGIISCQNWPITPICVSPWQMRCIFRRWAATSKGQVLGFCQGQQRLLRAAKVSVITTPFKHVSRKPVNPEAYIRPLERFPWLASNCHMACHILDISRITWIWPVCCLWRYISPIQLYLGIKFQHSGK